MDWNGEMSALAARVEDVCLNVWPAPQELHYDGWLIRLADGKTRRTNSVNVLRDGVLPVERKIDYCERVYRRHGLPSFFRILSTGSRGLDNLLAARGYDVQDETRALYMDFARHPIAAPNVDVELTPDAPTAEWLAARARIIGLSRNEMAKFEKILLHLALPAVFAAVRDETGDIRSLAKGAVHDGIVCVNLVATEEGYRQRGLSRACVSAILDWARRQADAAGACLQVVAANAPAVRMYEQMGFDRELYRYHYRHLALSRND
jgi:GNAT superfamily N-acetyltransferase